MERAREVYRKAAALPGVRVAGIDCHIGSQLTRVEPIADALDRMLVLVDELTAEGIELEHLDIGGGIGIRYRDEEPPAFAEYASALRERIGDRPLKLLLEPGRTLVGNAGVMLTRVEYLKHNAGHDFAIVDAGMNDLLRPALYQAWQSIDPVRPRADLSPRRYDIGGPVCESADFLGRGRELALAEGDLLAVGSCGAYGFVMASQYNSRPRPPEILVDAQRVHVVRERETWSTLWAGERVLPLD